MQNVLHSFVLIALAGPALIFVRSWRGRGTCAIALASLPVALLLVALGAFLSTYEALQGFKRIAVSGHGGVQTLLATCKRALDPLAAGTTSAAFCMAAAALLQIVAHRISSEAPTSGLAAHSSPPTRGLEQTVGCW